MKNKILILLMSCNKPLYENEEAACRETFLTDAENWGISYYFYKGTSEIHPEALIDKDNHVMYLAAPDTLAGTSKKTLEALKQALSLEEDWDYLIKTNVSTYLNIENIVRALDRWEGREDANIYGARFLTNKFSLHVPFPRGHFTILSRSMVSGLVDAAQRLVIIKDMPKTDDTLIGLSLLYYVQKLSGNSYIKSLMEVPAVNTWGEDIINEPELPESLCVRCKNEADKEATPDNLRKVHALFKDGEIGRERKFRRRCTLTETGYGLMTYELYCRIPKNDAKKK